MVKRSGWINKVRDGVRRKLKTEPAAMPAPRERLVFESLEPRLLLSDSPIPLPAFNPSGILTVNVHSGDLKVETVYSGGTPQIRIWDNTVGVSLGQIALTQNVKISIQGLPGISDHVQVDLGYDDGNAAGTNPVTPFAVMVELDGGTDIPLITQDSP